MIQQILVPVTGICQLRTEPSHRAELSSQLFLGEALELLDDSVEGWVKVRTKTDQYEGWCQAIQTAAVTEELPALLGFFDKLTGFANVNGQPMPVFKGSPVYAQSFRAGGFSISFTGLSYAAGSPTDISTWNGQVTHQAFEYLNTPYLWGGRSFSGIDCSGFAQMVFRQLGIQLRRDAWMQAAEGIPVASLQDARCGDLAFFDEAGQVTHVGILLNNREIIHSSGKVRIDDIDTGGIRSRDQQKRTHHLHSLRRYR
ncbi:MAG: C40 family peptidase [Flavihumibacter sp.]